MCAFFSSWVDWTGCIYNSLLTVVFRGEVYNDWVARVFESHLHFIFSIDFQGSLCKLALQTLFTPFSFFLYPIGFLNPSTWNPSPLLQVIDTSFQSLGFGLICESREWWTLKEPHPNYKIALLFPSQLIKMANQCSGHVFAIVQATNGNILTWRCSDCNSGPFVAIWRCKICGHCRCNACHTNKG